MRGRSLLYLRHDFVNSRAPLFPVDTSKALECAEKFLGKRFDVSDKLEQLTNPVGVLERVMTDVDLA
jgi:hypothetical protein